MLQVGGAELYSALHNTISLPEPGEAEVAKKKQNYRRFKTKK